MPNACCDAAERAGLPFIPLTAERYGLVFHASLAKDTRLDLLLSALSSRGFAADLERFSSDPACAGAAIS